MYQPLLIVIAPRFAIGLDLAEARQFDGDWRWFPTRTEAVGWLARCQEHGVQFDLTWIDYDDSWEHPDITRRRELYGE